MATKTSILCVCTTAVLLGAVSGQLPGAAVKIHPKGINLLRTITLNFIREKLTQATFPRYIGENHEVKDSMVRAMTFGRQEVVTRAPNIFKVKITNGSITFGGNWKAQRSENNFIGRYTAFARTFNMELDFTLSRTSSSRAMIGLRRCSASIPMLRVRVQDTNINWIINLFQRHFSNPIRQAFRQHVCSAVTRIMRAQTAKIIRELTLHFPLLPGTRIDLGLLRRPVVTDTSISLAMEGRCYPGSRVGYRFPFSSLRVPALSSTTRMARLSISEYVLNTLLYVVGEAGRDSFQRTYTASQVQSLFRYQLTTSALRSRVDRLSIYPGRPLDILLQIPSAVSSTIRSTGITVNADIMLRLRVLSAYPSYDRRYTAPITVLHINVRIVLVVRLSVNNDKIRSRSTSISVSYTDGERFPAGLINRISRNFASSVILPAINNAAESVFAVPDHFGYEAHTVFVTLKERAIEMSANFKLK